MLLGSPEGAALWWEKQPPAIPEATWALQTYSFPQRPVKGENAVGTESGLQPRGPVSTCGLVTRRANKETALRQGTKLHMQLQRVETALREGAARPGPLAGTWLWAVWGEYADRA